MKRIFFSILFLIIFYHFTFSQSVGIKTNLVHWATTTPNVGVEFALNSRYTMDITGGVNPFKFKDNKKIQHWIVQPELRYWTHESFNRHFFGLHILAGAYNVGGNWAFHQHYCIADVKSTRNEEKAVFQAMESVLVKEKPEGFQSWKNV